jgi:hypothetical protein
LATSLDAYLSDPARAAAVLPALGRVWPELLQSIAMGLRQAPSTRSTTASPRGQPSGSSPLQATGVAGGGTSYRAVTTAELSSMVLVLELACLLALQARQTSLEAGLLPLLLAQLPAAPPDLACACLDACLAIQLRSPAAFVSFSGQQGVQQVCRLMRDGATPEPVRAHAVQFLNLLLTQVRCRTGAAQRGTWHCINGSGTDMGAAVAAMLIPCAVRFVPTYGGQAGLAQRFTLSLLPPLLSCCPPVP